MYLFYYRKCCLHNAVFYQTIYRSQIITTLAYKLIAKFLQEHADVQKDT